MRIAMTGASGLLGGAVTRVLTASGHEVVAAKRGDHGELRWDLEGGFTPPNALSGFTAVVHLAGENIANGRWTAARKAKILDSRREGTRRVVEALERAEPRPTTLLSASAVGYYGDRGDERLHEGDHPGKDFLAEVAQTWETEAERASALGVRVVRMRFGMVLDPEGGALAKLLLPFRLGLGAQLGHGEQYMAWIDRRDVARAVLHLLEHPDCQGAFNVCAPTPVTNREFTRTLAHTLRRPALVALPRFAMKAALGEMAEALLLSGQRAVPERLLAAGFSFQYPTLDASLASLLAAAD